ncbi:MAG: nucleotidyltransferase [Epsilonproteobacteria bacterium]|nr:MAG: nucleotidyltransferase [Campylobacterota bacterium]
MSKYKIEIPIKEIEAFCKKWKVAEFALFGSVLREDFDIQKSDIDILYVFTPDAKWGWDIVDMKEELENIFGRHVDLVSKKAIEKSSNPYRKESILSSYEVIYDKAA